MPPSSSSPPSRGRWSAWPRSSSRSRWSSSNSRWVSSPRGSCSASCETSQPARDWALRRDVRALDPRRAGDRYQRRRHWPGARDRGPTAFLLVLVHRGARRVRAPHRPGAPRLRADRARREGDAQASRAHVSDEGTPPEHERGSMVVAARKSGVVTKIGSDDLVEEARRVECVLELVPALGEFVPAGAPLFRVHEEPRDLDENRLHAALVLALEPTLDEDVGVRAPAPRRHRGTLVGRLAVSGSHDRSAGDRPAARPARAAGAAADPGRSLPGPRRSGPKRRVRDDLGCLRSPRLRRDSSRRRGLATGDPPSEGRAYRSPIVGAARSHCGAGGAARALAVATETAMEDERDAEMALRDDRGESARPRRSMRARSRSSEQVPLFRGWRNGYGGTPYQGVAHDSPVRSDRNGAPASVDPDPESRRRPGADGRSLRRDVDVHELHVPVLELPRPAGRAAFLRPRREHRRRGIRSRRARRDGDQHHAHGSDAGVQRTRSHRARDEEPARRREGSATRATSSPAARARFRRTRRAGRGQATTSSSGDLVEDLTHNFFLETGARNNKLKVYEMVEHPAARAHRLPARAWRGSSGRLRTGAREPHGREPDEDVSDAANRDGEDPGVPAAHRARRSPPALPLLARRLPGAPCCLQRAASGDGGGARRVRRGARGVPPRDLPPQPAVFAPGYAPEEIAEIAQKLRERAGLPKEPTGLVADLEEQAKRSTKKASSRAKARA